MQLSRNVTYVPGSKQFPDQSGTHVLEESSRKVAERTRLDRFLSGRYRFPISSRSEFSSARASG
jgi:hypothetical protein